MRVAILLLNAGRGSGEVARQHARYLVASGWEVDYLHPRMGDGAPGVAQLLGPRRRLRSSHRLDELPDRGVARGKEEQPATGEHAQASQCQKDVEEDPEATAPGFSSSRDLGTAHRHRKPPLALLTARPGKRCRLDCGQ